MPNSFEQGRWTLHGFIIGFFLASVLVTFTCWLIH